MILYMTSDRSMCDKLWQHRLKKLVSAWSVTSRKKAKAKAKAKAKWSSPRLRTSSSRTVLLTGPEQANLPQSNERGAVLLV